MDETHFRRRIAESFSRLSAACDIVREVWPWLDERDIVAIAKILVDGFNKR